MIYYDRVGDIFMIRIMIILFIILICLITENKWAII